MLKRAFTSASRRAYLACQIFYRPSSFILGTTGSDFRMALPKNNITLYINYIRTFPYTSESFFPSQTIMCKHNNSSTNIRQERGCLIIVIPENGYDGSSQEA